MLECAHRSGSILPCQFAYVRCLHPGCVTGASPPARFKISECLSAQFCGPFPAKHGTFPSNLFPVILFRTLFPNGRTATLLESIRSALFLSQRGCGGYDPAENSRVSPAGYQLSTIDFGLSCDSTRPGPLPLPIDA